MLRARIKSDLELFTLVPISRATVSKESSKINSIPPPGKCKVVNIYVDPSTNKLVIEYDDTPK